MFVPLLTAKPCFRKGLARSPLALLSSHDLTAGTRTCQSPPLLDASIVLISAQRGGPSQAHSVVTACYGAHFAGGQHVAASARAVNLQFIVTAAKDKGQTEAGGCAEDRPLAGLLSTQQDRRRRPKFHLAEPVECPRWCDSCPSDKRSHDPPPRERTQRQPSLDPRRHR